MKIPLSLLFITPATDNRIPYSRQKVKTFYTKPGPYYGHIENFIGSLSCGATMTGVLGPKKDLLLYGRKILSAIFEGGAIMQNMKLDENQLSADNDTDFANANRLQYGLQKNVTDSTKRRLSMIHKAAKDKLLILALIMAGFTLAGCVSVHTTKTQSSPPEPRAQHQANSIRLEHVAINVEDPVEMAKWYCDNLGMKIVRKGPPPVNMHFISDAGGNMMLEIYNNPPDAVPDYRSMEPLSLHIAFMVDDVEKTRRRLVAAGAAIATDITVTESGDKLVMLRDPWGVPIQFLKRADPMLPY
jgi:catechol 2,3-dioxygenase-like lactoylglutathione lyase family enzyme